MNKINKENISPMSRELKGDEKWALDLLSPLIGLRYKNGFTVDIPESDPPDCILKDKDGKSADTKVEFTALGPTKYFEFVAIALKKKTPFFAELQIPYEPEFWLQDVIDRKSFPQNDKYDVLCTHFCSHFILPGGTSKFRHSNMNLNPYVITKDMEYRFYNVAWKNKGLDSAPKAIVLVQPEQEPLRLMPQMKPGEMPDIDIEDGYPTIQLRLINYPMGEKLEWDKLEDLSRVFRPFNKEWKKPDKFRIPRSNQGHTFSVVHRDKETLTENLVEGSLIIGIDKSMPVIKYVKD